jgi:hypothetical protein
MQRAILITISFICQYSISAQKPFSKMPKYSFGLFVAPHISSNFSTFKQVNIGQSPTFKPIFTYDFGINVQYHSNPRESYETGLNFTQQGYKELGDFRDIDNTPIENGYFHDKISYFQLPIKYNYVILRGRLSLQISLGAAANLLATVKTTLEAADKKIGNYTMRNRRITNENFSLMGGFNCEYKLNEKTTFRLSPYFQCFLRPISQETQNIYPIALGLQVSTYWRV